MEPGSKSATATENQAETRQKYHPTAGTTTTNINAGAKTSTSILNQESLQTISKNNDDGIEYINLTFDTEVATTPVFPEGSSKESIPPIPDLTSYDDPFGWSLTRKRLMTWLACAVNAIAAYAAGSYASPAAQLEKEWHVSYVAYNVGITIFTVGFGTAPMVLAPFNEISGRRPVFIATGIVFVVCQMWCALANNYGSMLAARFFLGIGGSTFSTMGGGILADIWVTKDRNTAMVIFTGATLFGTGLGPLISGFVAQNLLWRWVFYIQIMTSGVLVALVTLFFQETRGSVLLSRKARALNKWYEDLEAAGASGVILPESSLTGAQPASSIDEEKSLTGVEPPVHVVRLRYKVKSDEERASLFKMIAISCYRPMHMLITEPVIFWFSLWISFAWSVLYLQFGSIPLVFEQVYDFTLQETGAVFAAMCVGAILMTILSITQDKWAVKHFPHKMTTTPEARLYFTCVQSAFLPLSLFWFGWTCFPTVPWIVPAVAIAFATAGIFSIFLAVFNYSADVYRTYASSALAASSLCRNLLGGSFPLVTRQMFTGLGFHAASSLLAGISLVLTLVPWVLVLYGPRIRKRSRIARNFVEEDERKK